MDVFLVRHAIARDRDAAQWPDDSIRPLTDEGERKFIAAARGLKRIVSAPEVHLASPFARAWRTAEILHEEAGWPKPEPTDELGEDASSSAMLELLRRHQSARTVALVGHEPDLSGFAGYLLSGHSAPAQIEMKKGAVALLTIDPPAPGSGVLRWLLQPKALRALDR